MSRGLVKTSRYSPGNMTGEALEQLFVGRDSLMREILKRITASATRKEKHFLLLVGPRGMGKTHFVSLANHKLRTDPTYAKARARLKIAYLNEEEWGVASFLDLLVRILRALVAEKGDPGLSAGINRIYETFKKSPQSALQVAESLIIDHVQGDTLLLICENLSDLFDGLGEEGQQRWRSFIQEHPFWTILATTPALFSGVQLQSSPFYNFFTIKPLDRLDFDTAMALLRQKALMEGRTGLADFLLTPTGRARVRAIHHLAGGNHRVYVILSDFLTEESLEELVGPFMRMADDLTPYYQDRMRQLAPQQRKIIELLCQEARPIIVKDIAMRCLISPQVAAKQLGELAKLQFVLSTKVGRESYYELAEPLMRICVDIKDNRTEHFKLFVDFLRHWFSGRELRTKLELLKQAQPEIRRFDRLHIEVALKDFSLDPREPFLEHLDAEARRCFESKDYQGVVDAIPRLLKERPAAHYHDALAYALLNLNRFEEAFTVARNGINHHPNSFVLHAVAANTLRILDRPAEALQFANHALKIEPGEPITKYLIALILTRLDRHPDAEKYYREYLNKNPDEPGALHDLFRSLIHQNKQAEAVALMDSAYEVLSTNENNLIDYGDSLIRIGRHEDSLTQTQKALELNPNNIATHLLRAINFSTLGRTRDAMESGLKALHLSPSDDSTSEILDLLLHLIPPSEILSIIDDLDKNESTQSPFWEQRARALLLLSRHKEAHEAARNARQNAPGNMKAAFLEAEALAGTAGFRAALNELDEELTGRVETVDQDTLTHSLHNILSTEHRLRGAVAMARQVPQLQALLEKQHQARLMPAILSELLDTWLEDNELADDEWMKAVPLLQSALADIPECRIPLEMLSVAVRYQQSGDRSILLELPLEQRSLLLEKMGTETD